MGDMMRILVTGAGGFVGRAVVDEARARGHHVFAVIRSAPRASWSADPGIEVLRADLTQAPALPRVDAVVHAAGFVGDDPDRHARDTLAATEALLAAIGDTRLVLVSSLAVYDAMQLGPEALMDESTPCEPLGAARNGYVAAKLAQEDICMRRGAPLWVMRPGIVYGPAHSWNAHMGLSFRGTHLQVGATGELPLVHLTHLARSIVDAAATPPGDAFVLNVIDDDRPARARFLAAHQAQTGWPRRVVPVSFGTWQRLTRLARPVSRRLPGLLREPVMRSRLMPLRYSNAALRAQLGGADVAPFEEMLARSIAGDSR